LFSQPQQVRNGQQTTSQIFAGQLPTKGINTRDAYARMAPDDAIDLINVVSDSYGMSTRFGFQEFAINLPGSKAVPTLMSYYPAPAHANIEPAGVKPYGQLQLKRPRAASPILGGTLFACTNGTVFDVTGGGVGPWVAQPNVSGRTTDYWSWLNYQNEASNFLCACNEDGGYYTYGGAGFSSGFSSGFSTSVSGFTHVVQGSLPGQINNVNPETFVYVASWKRRLWFIEKDSSRAWYLPAQQITGAATLFDFGANFRHGGRLVALVSWAADGGEGLDDYLVAFSSQGDVVIYKGTDPDSIDTFGIRGIWYVGVLPRGSRCVDPIGGDVHVLSTTGLTQLSKLMAMGQIAAEVTEQSGSRIDPLIRQYMETMANFEGWYVKYIPHEQMVFVGVPQMVSNQGPTQLVLKIRQNAWSRYQGIPMDVIANHDQAVVSGGNVSAPSLFGGGRVFQMFDNSLDFVTIAGGSSTSNGTMIKCRLVGAYQDFGTPGMFKNFNMVRPTFIAPLQPLVKLTLLTDYGQSYQFTTPTLPSPPNSRWNVSNWDQALWVGMSRPIKKWLGINGGGYSGTAQIDYVAAGGTRITAIDYNTEEGGPL